MCTSSRKIVYCEESSLCISRVAVLTPNATFCAVGGNRGVSSTGPLAIIPVLDINSEPKSNSPGEDSS